MLSLPIPFVVSLLLGMVLLALLAIDMRRAIWLKWFVFACMVASLLVGFRWTVDVPELRLLRPVVASVLPPLALFSLSPPKSWKALFHIIPCLIVFALGLVPRRFAILTDGFLCLEFLAYGAFLIWFISRQPQIFADTRLTDLRAARQASYLVASLLIFSGFVDFIIGFDSFRSGGAHLERIVSVANLISLPILVLALLRLAVAQSGDDPAYGVSFEAAHAQEPGKPEADEVDKLMFSRFEDAMLKEYLYRDPSLTLNRISRRLRIPARQLSGAINRVSGKNLSQVVNDYRIKEAKELLLTTKLPVTEVMFECGFQTKSNFNREFLRVEGISPSDFRRSAI